MRQAVVVGVVLTAIAAAGEVSVTAQDTSRALRPESAAVRAVMTRGLERSGAFRDLTSQLSRSDLVVYMRFSRCPGDVGWMPPLGFGRARPSAGADQARPIRPLAQRTHRTARTRTATCGRSCRCTGDTGPGLLPKVIRRARLEGARTDSRRHKQRRPRNE